DELACDSGSVATARDSGSAAVFGAASAGAQHVAFSLSSQHAVCRSVLQQLGAAGCGGASVRTVAGDWNSVESVMVTP
ncbi:hypothetical protein AB0346_21700, partial [Nocardia beijingensis]|uniref:hypothetical protein n=1 Tax=Nocardia beijingensis TaxID=95162 RepID=UPI00344B2D82